MAKHGIFLCVEHDEVDNLVGEEKKKHLNEMYAAAHELKYFLEGRKLTEIIEVTDIFPIKKNVRRVYFEPSNKAVGKIVKSVDPVLSTQLIKNWKETENYFYVNAVKS